jgi:hypothetical protein
MNRVLGRSGLVEAARGPRAFLNRNYLEDEDTMKKNTQLRPLQLSRETIRHLDTDKLAGIKGGLETSSSTVIPPTFSRQVSC